MDEPRDELELRNKVRKSLESIMGEAAGAGGEPADLTRVQAILDEETERYYDKAGLVRHVSRSGRVHWVTAEEKERLDLRHKRKRRRRPRSEAYEGVKLTTVLVWVVTALFAAVLLTYLFATQTIG